MGEEKPPEPLKRRIPPDTRTALTHKFEISGYEGYITVGLFEDGTPCELFITMAKEGSTIGGLLDGISSIVTLSLQYGVPLEAIVKKLANTRFEPSGLTKNPGLKSATSVIDYVFRWMWQQCGPKPPPTAEGNPFPQSEPPPTDKP